MNGEAKKRKRNSLLSYLWKGPLGCLGFALGLTLVLSISVPFACGKVSESRLEAHFDRTHRGHLEIERARLGTLFGSQGFWGVRLSDQDGHPILIGDLVLPSVSQLIDWWDEAGVVELQLSLVELGEVALSGGERSSNIQLALSAPEEPRNKDALEEMEADRTERDRTSFSIESRGEEDKGSVRIEWSGGSLDALGSSIVELRGTAAHIVWRDPEHVALLGMSSAQLTGAIRGAEGVVSGTVGTIELRGELESLALVKSRGELHVLVRYQSNTEHEFSPWPTELVVELEGGDAALAETLDDVLSILSKGSMQRQGTETTWTLVGVD